MGIFANPLTDLLEYEDFSRDFLKGTDPVGMTGCIDSEKVHFMSTFLGEKKVQLVVTYNEQRAREIEEDYKLFCSQVYVIPPRDLIFFSADLQGNAIIAERMKAFAALYQNEAKVIITTMDALMSVAVPFEQLMSHVIKLKEGDELDLEKLKHDLTVMGYERVGRVEEPGQFTVHGGIADVYPLTMEVPVRIELWGDEIDTIRCFEPQSQRSMDQIECVSVFPAAEVIADDTVRRRAVGMIQNELESQLAVFKKVKEPDKAKRLREETNRILEALGEDVVLEAPDSYISYFYPRTVQLSEYFDEKNTLVFLDEPMRLKERGDGVQAEFEESMKNRLEQGFLLPGQTALLTPAKHVLAAFERGQVAALSSLDSRLADFTVVNSYAVNVQNMNTYREGFELLIKDLTHWKKEKYRIVLLCPSRTRANRIVNQLIEYDLLAYYSEDEDKKINPGEIMVTYGNLHRGFLYPMLKFAVITESDIFGVKKKKKEKKRLAKITQLKLINKNNYIGQTSRRLRKSQGAAANIAIRVFALLMCVIIIGCAANSIKAYRRYQDIDACSDIIAFNKTDKSTNYMLCYGYKDYRAKDYYISGEKEKIWTRDNLKSDIQNTEYLRDINKEIYDKSGKRCYDNDPVTGESRMYYNRFGSYELMYNIKPADTIMYKACLLYTSPSPRD